MPLLWEKRLSDQSPTVVIPQRPVEPKGLMQLPGPELCRERKGRLLPAKHQMWTCFWQGLCAYSISHQVGHQEDGSFQFHRQRHSRWQQLQNAACYMQNSCRGET